MPNEINASASTGATLTARLIQGTAQVGTSIAMTESGTIFGWYTGSVPGGTAAGRYSVRITDTAGNVQQGDLRWDGTAEVLPAPISDTTTLLARVTAAVPLASDWTSARAALVDRLDVLVSSRNAVAPDNAGITSLSGLATAIKAKTDGLPAAPAAVSDIPVTSAIASAVLASINSTTIPVDAKKVNGVTIYGGGVPGTSTFRATP